MMRCLGVALLVVIGWCSAANAIPVEVQYTGVVTLGGSTPAFANDPITIDFFADNHQSSIDNQSWSLANITSETVTIGSGSSAYVANMSGAFINPFSFITFSTNASGQLTFFDTDFTQFGTDNLPHPNTGFGLIMGGFNSPAGFTQFWVQSPITFSSTADSTGSNYLGPTGINTTIISLAPTTNTPLPAALPLFATGLGGLGLLGWRRKRKAQAV
jgi:hypothetical protein